MFELSLLIIGSLLFLTVWAIPFLPFMPKELSRPNIYNNLLLFMTGIIGWAFILVILKDYMNQTVFVDLTSKYKVALIISAASPIYAYIKYKR